MEDESSEIKEKKMQALKERMLEKQAERQKMLEQEMQIESILKQALSQQAKERLSNVKLVNQELYSKAMQALIYLASSGKLSRKLSEEELKELLSKLNAKKEITIKRK